MIFLFTGFLSLGCEDDKKYDEIDFEWKSEKSVCVVLCSKGYPENYEVGLPITFKNIEFKDLQIFHSGTAKNEKGEIISAGGRVLSIVCQGDDFDSAFNSAYKALKEINFDGIYYRRDIGYQVRENFSYED